ncbi:hypothetical protein [Sphingomonas sp. G-3-2-10]|uniref:hypothetical protein n=1 Tax=Sphingomonas sp. G-3-2-10 TaxID=2728838 RepID=UPI001F102736|nr:hypothetical protein [Sphingomonas sp. G-3-2-10]
MDSIQQFSVRERLAMSFRERGAAFVCAVAIEILIALLFLFALMPALSPKEKKEQPPLFGFDVSEGDPVEPKEQRSSEARPKGAATEKARVTEQPAPPVETELETPTPPTDSNVIWMTRRDYAATDVSRSRASGNETPAAGQGEGRGTAGDSERVEGSGPNGEPLYAAEWHRRPTNAELSTYLPARARQSGWGLIACRTVANYRVEDCIELGDSPRGSGLAGAVRQAAFQFRVRPPRVGGKPLVGSWVRIRIDYTLTRETEPRE